MSTVVTTDPTAPVAVKIFGRQPALWVGLIEALVIAVSYFNVGLTPETAALVNALVVAVGGAYVAWATKQTNISVFFTVAKALLALAIGLGLHLTPEQQAVLMTLASTILGFVNMTQNTPVAFPAADDGTQSVTSLPEAYSGEMMLSNAADAGVYSPAVASSPEASGSVDGSPVAEVYEQPEADQVPVVDTSAAVDSSANASMAQPQNDSDTNA